MVSSVLPAYSAETAEPPHSSPLESSSQILYRTESPPRLSSDTTCSGYKHFTLIYEKTSIPLSARGAYIAIRTPYMNIWCLQYFPLIQRRQRNRHTYKVTENISTSAIGGVFGVCIIPTILDFSDLESISIKIDSNT